MKYEIEKMPEDGSVILKLGMNNAVSFDKDATPEDIVFGVQTLIEQVTGISAFELVNAVVDVYLRKEVANDG
jgi:hypothetical protein